MRVKRLKMESFRGIGDLTLDFDELEPTVLIGINGVGKSSIVDAISLLMSRFIDWIGGVSIKEKIKVFNESDIYNNADFTRLYISVLWDGGEEDWQISRMRNSISQESGYEKIRAAANAIWRHWQNEPQYNIPLIVHYPVNRAVIDINLKIPNQTNFQQIDAYKSSVMDEKIDFNSFFQWFRNREDLESELLRDNRIYRDIQLEAVRKAISLLLPNFSNLRVRRSPLRMTVTKDREELIINQLSDGEKCLLAMVGDLARRLAIANPGLSDPLQGSGVVLIDEIELHLHPKWQREIIPALTRTFPNCQFIVTTHSPQVVSHVKPEGIYILEKTENGVIAKRPESSFGRDSNQILEDLMDVPARPQDIKDSLLELFRLIDAGDLIGARELRQQLAAKIGADEPEFVKADVLIRRKEILNR
ncbi:AAA family ATPase [Nostoc spongiaeforme FACHB-130]|uniref:AAA family ATPase n=1 Tax=Nostoc spongiaeforme FACHB-130 TaxID=1357510 RepID=A0ABR8FQ41_9NOSO|nr:AAA family ATPase [Nostoc spongiaeforme]MBD2593436.1 AAA family ATPase [Nostoc spongiaeforme FACHB-130]